MRTKPARASTGSVLTLALLALAAVSASCAGVTSIPSTGSDRTLQPSALPDGLEARPGRPALVDGEAADCIPMCGEGRSAGGQLPDGRYQTEWFFGGYMTLESDGTWSRTEDSNAELSLPIRDDYRMAFFLDPVLVMHGTIDPDVPMNAASYTTWLADHPDLVVSPPEDARIGSLPAVAVDVRLAATDRQDNDDCGTDPCIGFIKNPAIPRAYEHVDGILGDDVYRFYFADISYSGTDHLLVIKVEARDEAERPSAVERAEEILRTVTVPARARGS